MLVVHRVLTAKESPQHCRQHMHGRRMSTGARSVAQNAQPAAWKTQDLAALCPLKRKERFSAVGGCSPSSITAARTLLRMKRPGTLLGRICKAAPENPNAINISSKKKEARADDHECAVQHSFSAPLLGKLAYHDPVGGDY